MPTANIAKSGLRNIFKAETMRCKIRAPCYPAHGLLPDSSDVLSISLNHLAVNAEKILIMGSCKKNGGGIAQAAKGE